jgi:hypothetical protein
MSADSQMLCVRTGKIMYESAKSAMQASVEFKRRKLRSANRSGFSRGEGALHSYHCEHCGSHHIGHATGKQRSVSEKMKSSRSWRGGGKRK